MFALWEAAGELLSIHYLLYLSLGIFVGMIVGVLPGMGGTAGMALLLPFVYGMDQTSALALMIGMLATTATGDTFPSILMGIPGGSSSATVLDGFAMSKQGQAARALSAAFTASALGGVFGTIVLTACVFVAKPLILSIGMGEQLLLLLLALSMVGSLAGRSPLKGLAAAALGLLLGTIGSAPATGELRYTFDSVYLSDGIPLTVMALGVFAMPEIIDLMRQRSAIAENAALGAGWRKGILDTFRNWWLVTRVSTMGAIIGILPGLGASAADWMAYGHVIQSSKDRSHFGKGDVRGVIAPEAANHAVRGGDLVPTLFFGIPGSGSMALLLGAFVLIGIQPGAKMVGADLDKTFVIIWSLGIASVAGTILCILLAGPISKLTMVRYSYLAPLITVVLMVTAFQATKDWGDLVLLMGLTAFGLFLKRFDWPRPALVVGFVLAHNLEPSIYQTAQVYGFSFLARPQAIVIALMVLASLFVGVRTMVKSGPSEEGEVKKSVDRRTPQIIFTLTLIGLVAYTLISDLEVSYLTRLFPMWVGIVAIVALGLVLLQQAFAPLSNVALADFDQLDREEHEGRPSEYTYLAWFLGFLGLVWFLGFSLAAMIFVFAFITVECGRPLRRNAVFGLGCVGVLVALTFFLNLEYPQGILPTYLDFPWWIQ